MLATEHSKFNLQISIPSSGGVKTTTDVIIRARTIIITRSAIKIPLQFRVLGLAATNYKKLHVSVNFSKQGSHNNRPRLYRHLVKVKKIITSGPTSSSQLSSPILILLIGFQFSTRTCLAIQITASRHSSNKTRFFSNFHFSVVYHKTKTHFMKVLTKQLMSCFSKILF